MPFDHGLRLNNPHRIANAREKPIEANKNQSVDGVEGLFLRSGSPQNVYLLPQHPNFHLKRCPRPKQICDHPNNEPDKISHPARASPDSRSTASQIEFATGTGNSTTSKRSISRSRRTLMEEMPRKSAEELEAECLRLLAMDPHTRGIKRVEIIRMYPKGTGPNWTYGALDPMPTRAGLAIAQTLIASVYGSWALED